MKMMKSVIFLMAVLTVSTSGFRTSIGARPDSRPSANQKQQHAIRVLLSRPTVLSRSKMITSFIGDMPRGGGWASPLRRQSSNDDSKSSTSSISSRPPFDFMALAKYTTSLAMQMGLIFGLFTGIDMAITRFDIMKKIPFWANVVFFYAFNLITSLFSPLPSQSDTQTKEWEYQKRNKPSWTPPGWVFAIMWPLFVFGTRAVTAAAIVQKTGLYTNSAIMALMFHLCIGSLWNTVNNVDRRLGFSVPVLYALALSKMLAAYRFYLVDPLLGKCLAATLTWITAAAALETHTWRINPDPDTGKPEPLYPAKGKWKTKFRWEAS
jgi:tryptophan-rich sensory protein